MKRAHAKRDHGVDALCALLGVGSSRTRWLRALARRIPEGEVYAEVSHRERRRDVDLIVLLPTASEGGATVLPRSSRRFADRALSASIVEALLARVRPASLWLGYDGALAGSWTPSDPCHLYLTFRPPVGFAGRQPIVEHTLGARRMGDALVYVSEVMRLSGCPWTWPQSGTVARTMELFMGLEGRWPLVRDPRRPWVVLRHVGVMRGRPASPVKLTFLLRGIGEQQVARVLAALLPEARHLDLLGRRRPSKRCYNQVSIEIDPAGRCRVAVELLPYESTRVAEARVVAAELARIERTHLHPAVCAAHRRVIDQFLRVPPPGSVRIGWLKLIWNAGTFEPPKLYLYTRREPSA